MTAHEIVGPPRIERVIALIRMRLADGPFHAALTANSRLGQPVEVTTVESLPPPRAGQGRPLHSRFKGYSTLAALRSPVDGDRRMRGEMQHVMDLANNTAERVLMVFK